MRKGVRLSGLRQTLRTMSSPASSLSALPLQPPSLEEETALFEERTSEMEDFFRNPRFDAIKRPYSASAVASKQGSMPVVPLQSTLLADKLFAIFTKAAEASKPVHTMGAIDPVQMTQMARHQEVVYVSGWAASSVLTTGNNEVGPDLGCVFILFPLQLSCNALSLGTTRILRCQIKSTDYSVPNNYMTRNTTMSD
jgi:isocitrate lyase